MLIKNNTEKNCTNFLKTRIEKNNRTNWYNLSFKHYVENFFILNTKN